MLTESLEKVVTKAAEDRAFLAALLADADAALAAAGLSLDAPDRVVLDEYCRVASGMSPAELDQAVQDYLSGNREIGLAAGG
ncbi:MAG: hypothetical protein HY908_21595 [Myxococcales bacterium]|nr:hypothetical protein [Myxococcales bacterium]